MGKSDQERRPKDEAAQDVRAGGWDDAVKVRTRPFNGPAGAQEPLRIAMTRDVYADLIGHAKESLDREICGVLLGTLCQDEHGLFLDIEGTLRGAAARGGGTHVTFTQETWNEIHAAKEQRFPKLQIVGWYHSHPGFGVEFSEMDLFIQRNFFGGPAQIAFVSDPLGGQEAIIAVVDGRIEPIKRFWVDGRERRCSVAETADSPGENSAGAAVVSKELSQALGSLNDRVRQLTETVEQQRSLFYNFLTFLGMLLAFCFVLATGYSLWRSYYRPIVPPEDMAANTMVVPINGKLTLVNVGVRKWEASPELADQILKDFERMIDAKREAEAAATRAATQPSPPGPQPPATKPAQQH